MQTHAPTRPEPETYLAAIDADSARVVEALSGVDPAAGVPTCPGWTTVDLARHLAEVQHGWAGIVQAGVTDADEARALHERSTLPESTDLPGTLDLLRDATTELLAAIRGRPTDAPVWTWSREQTAGFVLRRQAHEACVHRLDAELTAAPDGSARTLVDPLLAADGVDEVLRLVADHGPMPTPGGTTSPGSGEGAEPAPLVRIVASDTGATWIVAVDVANGTLEVADADPADGTVRPRAILTGTAEDLLCTFWGRPAVTDPHRVGDLLLLGELDRVLTQRPAR
ncbi:maleylpyruvate isomerase N-terminal domain-containing protein [Mobilicoccus pelagius]|uniref:Mycothiol-dependent maleylpyruvate isomerase metal-binding domain-containing protein n=1 Tax=Mobilicoccus pelagius NBRC 104925 TaxID=1089455 RepID=H5UMN0_9MICO|nr:maleylpyruvate isomerase N-terminal domain-containing protein [Mobilicoccus pelagius]GAB46988.1 hypothetical protein MOPEL_003_00110 [Mobilicoccus pelagius NBRC 104925]